MVLEVLEVFLEVCQRWRCMVLGASNENPLVIIVSSSSFETNVVLLVTCFVCMCVVCDTPHTVWEGGKGGGGGGRNDYY